MHVSQLFNYPIKSMGGISFESLKAEPRGFQNDRRWMLIDTEGRFISQREFAQLACWRVSVVDDTLKIVNQNSAAEVHYIQDAQPEDGEKVKVSIWNDFVVARHVSNVADELLSELLELKCKLVYMSSTSMRQIDPDYAIEGEQVSFADGYPYLITTTSSIQAICDALGYEVNINRFRPNIVIENSTPWEEDEWSKVKIGSTQLRLPKLCARCQVPAINQVTGEINNEVLQTLAKLRRRGNKVLFGVNACLDGVGKEIRVGDEVKVLEG